MSFEQELGGLKEDIGFLIQVNTNLENQIHKLNEKLKEFEVQKDELHIFFLFLNIFVSDDKPKENERIIHEENQLVFKCDSCDLEPNAKKKESVYRMVPNKRMPAHQPQIYH